MPTPHKHAKVIKAWADGHQIQIKVRNTWQDMNISSPSWDGDDYRIKPEPVVLHGFIDPLMLGQHMLGQHTNAYAIFRPTKISDTYKPCTLTIHSDE